MLSYFRHAQLFTTLWTVCNPPGYCVCGILQATIPESVVISFSRESSWPRDQNSHLLCLPHLASGFFTTCVTWKPRWMKQRIMQPEPHLWINLTALVRAHQLPEEIIPVLQYLKTTKFQFFLMSNRMKTGAYKSLLHTVTSRPWILITVTHSLSFP